MTLALLITPLYELLLWFFARTGSFGWSIILLTLVVRAALLPLTLPGAKAQRTMRKLAPQLKSLQAQHKNDKDALMKAQMALYKEHNFNPLSGCIPSLLQFVPLIALYQVLQRFITEAAHGSLGSTLFFGVELTQKDPYFILPLLAAASQFFLSLMLLPGAEKHDLIPEGKKSKKLQQANKQEDQEQDMATAMQRQMLFMAPLMTAAFGMGFPAGLSLYWIVSTILSIVQQYFITGWGGVLEVIPSIRQRLSKERAL